MDTKNEDTMVRQIEKNLSNHIDENLFLSGRVIENKKTPSRNSLFISKNENSNEEEKAEIKLEEDEPNYPLVSNEYINNTPITLSRAEYIRQAREACLRQLSNSQIYSRLYDVNYMDPEMINLEQQNHKKDKTWKLFQNGTNEANVRKGENSPQEIASFRSLIVRMVFSIVLFLAIFIIDKFEIKIGNLNHGMIQEYVTGNDKLQELEDIVVTWLK